MAGNPQLSQVNSGEIVPAPFAEEIVVLRRRGVEIALDGFGPRNRWKAKGLLFLSNVRLVFVANGARLDGNAELQAFDFPLVYIYKAEFKQPIFGCNHLSGLVWQAVEGGGPRGSLPPVKFNLYFIEGGVGTFLPLYFNLLHRARSTARWHEEQQQQQQQQQQQMQPVENLASAAFVDPQDPTTLYLAQPVTPTTSAPAPKYAANYGQDEEYQPLDDSEATV
eukprot:evm.model.scf_1010.6 EVM.evm.TU.scf_1010.6   scf_1010:34419-38685(-)